MKLNNITIGLPCYNEEKNITKALNECLKFIKKNKVKNYEILVVDNNSQDQTVSKIKNYLLNKKIKLIKNKKNIFYSGSVGKIIHNAKYNSIGIVDTDGQYDFSDFKKLFFRLNLNKDVIFGFRAKRKDSLFRIFVSKVFNFLALVILKCRQKDLNCGIKVLKRPKNFKKLLFKINHANPELYCLFKKQKKIIDEIEVKHRFRNEGESIHGIVNLFKTFFEVTIYFINLRKKYLK